MFKFPLSVWLLFCWLIQMPIITAFTKEADWKFENLQSSNQEWWQTLRIKQFLVLFINFKKAVILVLGVG